MAQAGIDIASGTGSTTLITTAATEHFWCDSITLIPSDTGEWELLSGSTVIAHVQVGVAGGQYTFFNLQSVAVGDNLILSRVGTLAMGGQYSYRVK